MASDLFAAAVLVVSGILTAVRRGCTIELRMLRGSLRLTSRVMLCNDGDRETWERKEMYSDDHQQT
jgi:hypothetical protein